MSSMLYLVCTYIEDRKWILSILESFFLANFLTLLHQENWHWGNLYSKDLETYFYPHM